MKNNNKVLQNDIEYKCRYSKKDSRRQVREIIKMDKETEIEKLKADIENEQRNK